VEKIENPSPSQGEEQPVEEDQARERSLQLGGGFSVGNRFGSRLGKYSAFLGEVRQEMRKVTWPTRKTVIVETIVVVAVVVFFTLLIIALDNIFAVGFNWFLFGQ
jgi:preprotein translocase subunit SecE